MTRSVDVTWSKPTDAGIVIGAVDGHRFELSGDGSFREFSFGGRAIGCSWHVREPDAPASLDGWVQVDPVGELFVLQPLGPPSGCAAVGSSSLPSSPRSWSEPYRRGGTVRTDCIHGRNQADSRPLPTEAEKRRSPCSCRGFVPSGWGDSNSRPLDPQSQTSRVGGSGRWSPVPRSHCLQGFWIRLAVANPADRQRSAYIDLCRIGVGRRYSFVPSSSLASAGTLTVAIVQIWSMSTRW